MGDRETLAKARRELEELYLGVPDDSVNLTFQDFAEVSQNLSAGKKKPSPSAPMPTTKKMDPISESTTPKHHHFPPQHLAKIPSLDFSRGLEAASTTTAPSHHHHRVTADPPTLSLPPGSGYRHHGGHQVEEVVVRQHGNRGHDFYGHGDQHGMKSHGHGNHHGHHVMENSMAYDDMSMMSGMSMTSMYQEKTSRRRPGIPHSNICTVCSVYIYIFRNRCLVCGRVYCRQCLNIGMGEMTEGRKYIHRAGNTGYWSSCFSGYPNGVKIQELKWAEKGPRRSAENRSVMMSKSRSPLGPPRTPNRAHIPSGPPSFVTTPDYTPYATPTRHHLPF
ncbi:hypothetical protein Ccrd_003805 [Cynara cardunculus var. scolymus]|uniref:Zinc finger, FYVE/PHD-type n=1 Tax=Cynara cardunculus var. scolymus TaxID=59895 RepID=A0A103XNQ7_CYNCS|nr:hypothetical protein Ccrd_003805 [Cynara cardunculus var. scolymus]